MALLNILSGMGLKRSDDSTIAAANMWDVLTETGIWYPEGGFKSLIRSLYEPIKHNTALRTNVEEISVDGDLYRVTTSKDTYLARIKTSHTLYYPYLDPENAMDNNRFYRTEVEVSFISDYDQLAPEGSMAIMLRAPFSMVKTSMDNFYLCGIYSFTIPFLGAFPTSLYSGKLAAQFIKEGNFLP